MWHSNETPRLYALVNSGMLSTDCRYQALSHLKLSLLAKSQIENAPSYYINKEKKTNLMSLWLLGLTDTVQRLKKLRTYLQACLKLNE